MLRSFIFASICFVMMGFSAVAEAGFSDVNSSTIYQKGIEYLQGEGLVKGNADGTFAPYRIANRAELAKMMVEASFELQGKEVATIADFDGDSCFTDVGAGQWYTRYICYAKSQGWVRGYGDGSFRPGQDVNFVEGLKIVYKGMGKIFEEPADEWYRDLVVRASGKNYIPVTIAKFDQTFKRGEVADLIARILKEEEGLLSDYLGGRAGSVVTYDTIKAGKSLFMPLLAALDNGDVNYEFKIIGDQLYAYGNDRVLAVSKSAFKTLDSNTFVAEEYRQAGNAVFVGVSPDGIGGYIIYGGPRVMFRLNKSTFALQEVNMWSGFATDVNADGSKLAYVGWNEEYKTRTISYFDFKIGLEEAFKAKTPFESDVSGKQIVVGDLIFAGPSGMAYAATAYSQPGVDEVTAIFYLDIKAMTMIRLDEFNGVLGGDLAWNENEGRYYVKRI